jgi:hypothetical protein
MERRKMLTGIWWKTSRTALTWEDWADNIKMALKQGRTGSTFISLKTQVGGCFEHGNEPSYSIRCG